MKKIIYKIFVFFALFSFGISTISFCDDIDDEIIDVNSDILSCSTTNQSEIKEPTINSRAYVVIDRKTNMVLYGKNENQKRKMASTTKIMTATIIIENCNLDETIEVSKKAAGTGGSRLGLKAGDKITIRDLLYGLMLRSGNDAAVALAEYVGGSIEGFAGLMNKKASELNLTNTHFETPHGLDSDEHYSTAYELSLLSNYALQNSVFAKIVNTKEHTININGYPKTLSNTNELLGNFEGVYGIKTGFTNGANRCLVTACKRNDIDIICVVLGADTKKFRTQDSIKLINYIFDNFKPVNVEELINNKFEAWKKENLDKVVINKSPTKHLDLEVESIDNPVILVRKDLIDSIKINIDFPLYFESPIASNSKLGNVNASIMNYFNYDYKIYNCFEIKHKSWYFYLVDILKNYSSIFNNII